MHSPFPKAEKAAMSPDDTAVILYSGGTTGTPKGILLSNMNFISEGMMVAAWGNLSKNDSILAILPIFRGFGLGVCINSAFMGGGNVKLLEGYGLTEAVTAIMAMPLDHFREGSVGIPFPDMDAKIVILNSTNEAGIGEDGELCLSGPAVMKGYLSQKEDTEAVLKIHEDKKLWLHTGDIAARDNDGFFYFKLRQKRMIKWSCPRSIEFRQTLPTTLVGKIAYKTLEDEEIEALRKQGAYSGDK